MRNKIFNIILYIVLLFLFSSNCFSFSQKYSLIIENNIFSPERNYKEFKDLDNKKDIKTEEFKKSLILRGIFKTNKNEWAILYIKNSLRRKLKLNNNRLLLKKNDKIGECILKEIRKDGVILGGLCDNLFLTFKDNPERKKKLDFQPMLKNSQTSKNTFTKKRNSNIDKKQNKKGQNFVDIIKSKLKKTTTTDK